MWLTLHMVIMRLFAFILTAVSRQLSTYYIACGQGNPTQGTEYPLCAPILVLRLRPIAVHVILQEQSN